MDETIQLPKAPSEVPICYFAIFSNVNDQVIGEVNTLHLSDLKDKDVFFFLYND